MMTYELTVSMTMRPQPTTLMTRDPNRGPSLPFGTYTLPVLPLSKLPRRLGPYYGYVRYSNCQVIFSTRFKSHSHLRHIVLERNLCGIVLESNLYGIVLKRNLCGNLLERNLCRIVLDVTCVVLSYNVTCISCCTTI